MGRKSVIIIFLVVVILSLVFLFTRSTIRPPEFVDVQSIELLRVEGTEAEIKAVLKFHNPNSIKAELLNTELKIYSDDTEIGLVSQNGMTDIKPKAGFDVPVQCRISLLRLGLSQSLSGLLEQAMNEEKVLRLRFDGYSRIKIAGKILKVNYTHDDEISFH